MNTLKALAVLGLTASLSACVAGNTACTSTKACIETTKPVGNTFEGTVEQLVEVRIPGQAPSHIVRSSDGLGGRLVEGILPVAVGGLINRGTALAVADRQKCAGPTGDNPNYVGCGNIVVQGAQAVAGSNASSEANVDNQVVVGRPNDCATCTLLGN